MDQYIEFNLVLQKPKTMVYAVGNIKSQSIIGYIQWHGPWRQYCFFPEVHCVFSKGCLKDIIDFLNSLRRPNAK
jgi:hypothetical protein